jgi:hypothetical protein
MQRALTPALAAVLSAVLESGPFPVYEWRGTLGYSKLRIRVYEPPPMTSRTFKRLRELGLVRKVVDDDFKQIWDISPSGIEALRRSNDAVRALLPQFAEKRLDWGARAYAKDGYGLATKVRQAAPASGSATLHHLGPAAEQIKVSLSRQTAADARCAASGEKLRLGHLTLGALANECLDIIAAFLADQTGSIRVKLKLEFAGQQPVKSSVTYAPRSFDAPVAADDISHLGQLLASICELQPSGLRGEDKAFIECIIMRRKRDGAVRFGRLPEDAEIRSTTEAIRAAVREVAPAGLANKPYLRVWLCGGGNIEWSSNGHYGGRRALFGQGCVKANRAVWRARSGIPNCKIELLIRF